MGPKMKEKRWPRRPPQEAMCDTYTTWTQLEHGPPQIHRCPHEAQETVIGISLPKEVWLCYECADKFEASGIIRRNPKRKRLQNPLS